MINIPIPIFILIIIGVVFVGYLLGVVMANAWESDGMRRKARWIAEKRPGPTPGDRIVEMVFGDGRKVEFVSLGDGAGVWRDAVPKTTIHKSAFFKAWAKDDFDLGWIMTAAEEREVVQKFGPDFLAAIFPILKSVAIQADEWHEAIAGD